MAKYEVEHSCGHTVTHQLYGKQADRLRKIEWMERRVCPDCWKKQQDEERQAKNAAAAAANAAADLPALEGTEKQIAWAESIRAEKVARLAELATGLVESEELVKKAPAFDSTVSKRRQVNIDAATCKKALERISGLGFSSFEEYFRACHQAIENLQRQTSASWWIDNRDVIRWQDIIEQEAVRIIASAHEDTDDAEQAMVEATLSPAEPVSNTPAEISASDNVIRVKYPIKDRRFWEIVKPELGFTWSGKCWEKKIGTTDGKVVDRIAEAGHRLLAAGFKVVIWDEVAREKSITGNYEPRYTRWIVRLESGKFGIRWGRKEDFYREARRIASARWSKPYVTVLPSEYLEVLDFAEIHDFRLTPGAQEMVAEQQQLATAATVVDVEPVDDETAGPQERPELDPGQVSGEIDEDLRDD